MGDHIHTSNLPPFPNGQNDNIRNALPLRHQWNVYTNIQHGCSSAHCQTSVNNTSPYFLCFMLRLASFDPSHLRGQQLINSFLQLERQKQYISLNSQGPSSRYDKQQVVAAQYEAGTRKTNLFDADFTLHIYSEGTFWPQSSVLCYISISIVKAYGLFLSQKITFGYNIKPQAVGDD